MLYYNYNIYDAYKMLFNPLIERPSLFKRRFKTRRYKRFLLLLKRGYFWNLMKPKKTLIQVNYFLLLSLQRKGFAKE